jgi:dihydrofolate reductase
VGKFGVLILKLFSVGGLCRWRKRGRTMSSITYSYIVARARNGVIGCDNQLPWHLPTDLRKFRDITMGKPLIMGRRTFESIGRALPGRSTIVVSRENGVHAEGVQVARTKEDAQRFAEQEAVRRGVTEVMVIGGAEIFQLFKDEVDTVYLTEIDAEVEGDAYFRDDFSSWNVVERQAFAKEKSGDQFSYDFVIYRRPTRQTSRFCRWAAE